MASRKKQINRRNFIKTLIGGCTAGWTAFTLNNFQTDKSQGLRVGFQNDAPASLWQWATKAMWSVKKGELVHCNLCPHQCILAENDRGFCRTRVVMDGTLQSLAYGNPCAVNIDPVEKKPLYHFIPGSSILSIATAGCNLRCKNCQNWQISQAKPEETRNYSLLPDQLTATCSQRSIPAIAYTYSDPIVFYEYVYDAARAARKQNIKNTLVTAGYINQKPLRQLCKVTDAANVDLKGFTDYFYKKVTGATLNPVLRSLETMREEGVWLEITRLLVPGLSDDMDDLRKMCKWLVNSLGAGTPLHLSRFHPQYKLRHLPPTPLQTMEKAYSVAKECGLHFVYVGNVPGSPYQDTYCPRCQTRVIQRQGYSVLLNVLKNGHCPCGELIPGVWT